MPGRFKDFIAMPKFNRYPLVAHDRDRAGGGAARDPVADSPGYEEAEYGIAAHWLYKRGKGKTDGEWLAWVQTLLDWQRDEPTARVHEDVPDRPLRRRGLRLPPKGDVKTLPQGAAIDFAYAVHTDVGHKTVGAKINGRIVPLHYRLKNGDFVEVLTSKWAGGRPGLDEPRRLLARPQQDPAVVQARDARRDRGEGSRECRPRPEGQNLPYRKLQGSAVLTR